ncbi:glutaredoxin 2 [Leclercia adecarboxylata]|uniref:glutaredoxin 2 n=1 Tax=Leclercia TaxID=83654 RepID=UPI0012E8D440|nr:MULTISPECIES: glutaredoxin 2 [Leclercia]MEB5748356.1 glutaredoxin 2 [Leclercia adecarboxylata]QGW17020.1 glutaredoxin 2 [Leclercia sp. Colony189]URM25038.1 glutaredoxin 2 [Leclercia adecarboxylata]
MKLYVYEHCPFCIRARMIFGLKKVPFELGVIMEGDVETPTRMVGRKVVPILQKEEGAYMPESMDIVHYVDQLDGTPVIKGECDPLIEAWCKENTRTVFNLAIPRFTRADFQELSTPAAREAYTQREIKAFGDLEALLANSQACIDTLVDELAKIEPYLRARHPISITDFYLFPVLNSLTIVKAFPYPDYLSGYLDHVATSCNVPLFTDKAL